MVAKSKAKVRETTGDICFRVIVMAIVILLVLACLLPFLNIIALSLSDSAAVLSRQVSFWPMGLNWEAYKTVAQNGALIKSMNYTLIVTIIYVAITMTMTVLCAYPLSNKKLYGKGPLWMVVLFTMYFSGGMIPEYLLISNLGLIDSMWALILPGAISTYNMILMKTYFASIPEALHESAFIDGANDAVILGKIILPLSKPMLATIALFYAVSRWNAVQDGLLYINSPDKYIMQLRLRDIILSSTGLDELMTEGRSQGQTLQTDQIRSAALIFSIIPVMIVYPWLQKYFVKGVMIGSVKG